MIKGRWQGETAFVFASGPSLTQEDADACRGLARAIAVNATFARVPWADVLYAADLRFWRVYSPDIEACGFLGERWSSSESARAFFGCRLVAKGAGEGFSRMPGTINGGGNSGYQAVHLAASWGCSRIVLLGMDMQRTGGLPHWHGVHKGQLPNGQGFRHWIHRFGFLARDLRRLGVEVINCSRETALTCFQRRPLEEVLDVLRRP